jgi:hypothetical protein
MNITGCSNINFSRLHHVNHAFEYHQDGKPLLQPGKARVMLCRKPMQEAANVSYGTDQNVGWCMIQYADSIEKVGSQVSGVMP